METTHADVQDVQEVQEVIAAKVAVKVPGTLTERQINFLYNMLDQGGPDEKDYKRFSLLVDSLDEEGIEEMREVLSPLLGNTETIQGYAYSKPYGYAGDFRMIDLIYQNYASQDPKFRKWDLWWQKSHASQAVRNRKDFFKNLMSEIDKKSGEAKKILILGSGPATDVYEYLKQNPDSKLSFDLVDLDENAIAYAKNKNKEFSDRLNFFKINVLRFKTHHHYDLIWSAGLFDYFKEKHFIYLLKKYMLYLKEDGEIVIGNFSGYNPTRMLMEAFSDWYLNYRSEAELYNIAHEAGLGADQVFVDKESLGVNLFMRIKLDKKEFIEYKEPISKVSEYSIN